jgi:hypothetical protein
LEGLAKGDVGIFYGHFVYITDIWSILWSICIFYGYLVYFSRFGTLYQEKSGNTGAGLHLKPFVPLETHFDFAERKTFCK